MLWQPFNYIAINLGVGGVCHVASVPHWRFFSSTGRIGGMQPRLPLVPGNAEWSCASGGGQRVVERSPILMEREEESGGEERWCSLSEVLMMGTLRGQCFCEVLVRMWPEHRWPPAGPPSSAPGGPSSRRRRSLLLTHKNGQLQKYNVPFDTETYGSSVCPPRRQRVPSARRRNR